MKLFFTLALLLIAAESRCQTYLGLQLGGGGESDHIGFGLEIGQLMHDSSATWQWGFGLYALNNAQSVPSYNDYDIPHYDYTILGDYHYSEAALTLTFGMQAIKNLQPGVIIGYGFQRYVRIVESNVTYEKYLHRDWIKDYLVGGAEIRYFFHKAANFSIGYLHRSGVRAGIAMGF